jgi:protein-tyrosine-phosphatase
MGCGEECPLVPGARRQDWDLPDPAGRSIDFMRQIRDKIETKVKDFISK